MNVPVFWRLVWKEYRLQRAFWLAMIVLALLFEWFVLWFMRDKDVAFRTMWLFDVALALSALYALGCGATLFATEHEAGTYDFQRALPVSVGRLLFAKLAFAVASTLAMIGLLWLLAAVLAGGQLPEPQTHGEVWAMWGFATVETLLWGTFFSLLLERPLKAALLAAAAASASVFWIVGTSGLQYFREPYVAAVPYRAGFGAVLAAVTVWLGLRWFRERIVPSPRVGLFGAGGRATARAARALATRLPARYGLLGRLVWQHWRESAGIMAVLVVMVLPLLGTGIYAFVCVGTDSYALVQLRASFWFQLASVTAFAAAPLAGACVFLADQRRRAFRFLVERGVGPMYVWLSRQLTWLIPTLVVTLLAMSVLLLPLLDHAWRTSAIAYWLTTALALVMLAYAAGQIFSMFLSSGILAAVLGVALTVLFYLWAVLMMVLGVPWLWSVWPIPVVLLLATWLRTPYWLLERNTLRAWLPTVLSLAVPLGLIFTAFCLYRVYSVPAVDPGFDPAEFAEPPAPEARVTAEMYRRAMNVYRSPPLQEADDGRMRSPASQPGNPLTSAETTWLEENQKALELVLQATRRTACDFHRQGGRTGYGQRVSGFDVQDDLYGSRGRTGSGQLVLSFDALGMLLVSSARHLESEGDLEEAFQRYAAALRLAAHLRRGTRWPEIADRVERRAHGSLPFWAAHPDQTVDRIRTAIAQLAELERNVPSSSDALKAEHVFVERIIAGELAPGEVLDYIAPGLWEMAFRWLPWERARARRVLNLRTGRSLELLREVESAVRRNQKCPLADYPHFDKAEWLTWERTTPLFDAIYLSRGCFVQGRPYRDYGYPQGYLLAADFARMATRRRAVRLQLGLVGWRIEHGRLPDRLEELVGPFFDELPLDPYTAEPFQDVPDGSPAAALQLLPVAGARETKTVVLADKPYFQSAGRRRRLKCGSDRDFVFPIPPADE
jgi:hypothetical protein